MHDYLKMQQGRLTCHLSTVKCLFAHWFIYTYLSIYVCIFVYMYVFLSVFMLYLCVYFIMWTCLKFAIHEITKVWFFLNFSRHFREKTIILILVLLIFLVWRGLARTQVPTITNYTVELSTFGIIAEVSRIWVQWNSLALEEAPRWSSLLPRQVSMLFHSIFLRTSS